VVALEPVGSIVRFHDVNEIPFQEEAINRARFCTEMIHSAGGIGSDGTRGIFSRSHLPVRWGASHDPKHFS